MLKKELRARLKMSTSEHPETDGQTERANRVLEKILRGYVHSFTDWIKFLPMVEFAINNSVHASTLRILFFVNGLRPSRLLTVLKCDSRLRWGWTHSSDCQNGSHSSRNDEEVITYDADVDHIDFGEEESKSEDALTDHVSGLAATRFKRTVDKDSESADEFILARETVFRCVQDSIAEAVDHQKKYANKNGRKNVLYSMKVT